jgi:hypothetical protein
MQTYNYIFANCHLFWQFELLLRSRYAVSIPVLLRTYFFWDVTLFCLNDTFLTPQAFNVKTLLFESSDNSNPETDRYMPGDLIPSLLCLSILQTRKAHAIYKTAWTPFMLLQHSPLLDGRLSLQHFNYSFRSDQRHDRKHLTMDQRPLQGVCECLRQRATRRNLSQAASFTQHGTRVTLI